MLEALFRHYENMVENGECSPLGWCNADVSFALRIDKDGRLLQVLDLRKELCDGKKKRLLPIKMFVPEQKGRSGTNPPSYFLCDHAGFFLGIYNKGDNKTENEKRGIEYFKRAVELHNDILKDCICDAALAVCRFFALWKPDEISQCDFMEDYIGDLSQGENIVFMYGDKYVHEYDDVKRTWELYRQENVDSIIGQCLVTGRKEPIARLHPLIKGVKNAKSMGARLVSFKESAYESYGKKQGYNAPVSEYAAFAYSTALNNLLADNRHVKLFGDTTVVYWAERDNERYQDCFGGFGFQDADIMDEETLDYIFTSLKQDEPIEYKGLSIDYDNRFYILGLSPNAARLSVRFFLQSDFGRILKNAARHMENMEIVRPKFKKKHIPLWLMLAATVSPKAKDKAASPLLSGAVLKSILMGSRYPESLFQYVMLRIKAEQDDVDASPPVYKITYERCAIIKAYLCRNGKREITVALNEDEKDVAYVLGRIFAVWEHIQAEVNKGINATIKDRYFDSACATPARIFPVLQKLSGHHLRKLEDGKKIYFEKQLTSLMGKIDAGALPNILSLKEQGMFVLGYYHQVQARYAKKEDKENG